jgi:hypothetical protein
MQEGGSDLLRWLDVERVRNDPQLLSAKTATEYNFGLAESEKALGVESFLEPKEVHGLRYRYDRHEEDHALIEGGAGDQ